MIPKILHIENFFCHEDSVIDFNDFSSVVILGRGNNNSKISNGTGKSSIFAAIKYVLFNEVDGLNLEKIIRHNCDYARVSYEFSSNGQDYKIVRTLPRKSASDVLLFVKQNDEWISITGRRASDTNKEIEKIIKINSKTFSNSIFFTQNDLSGLASLTPGSRKKILKDVLQLGIYSKYEIFAKKKAADIHKEIEKIDTIIHTVGEPEKDILSFTDNLSTLDKNITNQTKLYTEKNSLLDNTQKKYTDVQGTLEDFEKQSLNTINKKKSLQSEISNLEGAVKEFDVKIKALKTIGSSLAEQLASIDKDITILTSKEYRLLETIKADIENISAAILDKTGSSRVANAKIADLKTPFPKDNTCKYCRQHITDEVRQSCKDSLTKEIVDTENKLKVLQVEIDKLSKDKTKLTTEYTNTETNIAAIKSKNYVKINIEKDIEGKRTLYTEYNSILDRHNADLSEKQKEFNAIQQVNTTDDTKKYHQMKLDIVSLQKEINTLKSSIDNSSKTIQSITNDKAVLLHKIESRKSDIEKIKTYQNSSLDLKSKYMLHSKVIEAFSSSGIPALITHTILDDFQVESNNLLSQLRPGLQLQFSIIKNRDDGDEEDTLNINYFLNGYDLEFNQLSGAQKLLASLAIKLGLAAVIKKRLGTEIHLLLIDEVDQSLDESGLEAFEAAIKKLQQDFKILVITHNNELKTKFSKAILVEQNEQFISKARVVDSW